MGCPYYLSLSDMRDNNIIIELTFFPISSHAIHTAIIHDS